MRNETVTFVGYKQICDYTVAEFRPLFPRFDGNGHIKETFVINRSSCEMRLKNLKKGGYSHDQTALALEQWPAGT